MYAQVEKPKENESKGVANSVTQKKSNVKQGIAIVDNRSSKILQCKKVETSGGSWDTDQYYSPHPKAALIEIKFTPNDTVDATKIALIQTCERKNDGAYSDKEVVVASSLSHSDGVSHVDSKNNNPIFGAAEILNGDLSSTPEGRYLPISPDKHVKDAQNYQLGKRTNKEDVREAKLLDMPALERSGGSMEFETQAVCIEGKQKSKFYGSVSWGFEYEESSDKEKPWNRTGLYEFKKASDGDPTDVAKSAMRKWNTTKIGLKGNRKYIEGSDEYKKDQEEDRVKIPI